MQSRFFKPELKVGGGGSVFYGLHRQRKLCTIASLQHGALLARAHQEASRNPNANTIRSLLRDAIVQFRPIVTRVDIAQAALRDNDLPLDVRLRRAMNDLNIPISDAADGEDIDALLGEHIVMAPARKDRAQGGAKGAMIGGITGAVGGAAVGGCVGMFGGPIGVVVGAAGGALIGGLLGVLLGWMVGADFPSFRDTCTLLDEYFNNVAPRLAPETIRELKQDYEVLANIIADLRRKVAETIETINRLSSQLSRTLQEQERRGATELERLRASKMRVENADILYAAAQVTATDWSTAHPPKRWVAFRRTCAGSTRAYHFTTSGAFP